MVVLTDENKVNLFLESPVSGVVVCWIVRSKGEEYVCSIPINKITNF